jgi:DNA-binding transcriptional regulator YdaS (Cro superfamily)
MARPIDTTTPLGRLAAAVGGQDRLAELLGVSTRTLRYWATGERSPLGPARLALERLYKRHKIDPAAL